ncbi:MAG: helix-turn-helix domain-containing protein [Pseudomonadota bacterium]
MKSESPLSPATRDALALLGGLIEEGRLRRDWSRDELAERLGVSLVTLRRLVRGDPRVAAGTFFEAATLVGVPLFDTANAPDLGRLRHQQDERLALLPARVRHGPPEALDDDF